MATPPGQRLLASAHKVGDRPRCLCTRAGVDMYVARRGATFYLARMPGTGLLHADGCPSTEDCNLYSGADHYGPDAMCEGDNGVLSVAYGDGPVSLNGLLDALFEVSELNVLRPGTPAPGWRGVREQLRQAAMAIHVRGGILDTFLEVPVAFAKDDYPERRGAQELFLSEPDALRLVCAPLREIRATRYGWQIVLKHMPDTKFWLSRAAGTEIAERAAGTLNLAAPPEHALVLMRVRRASKPGTFLVLDMALRQTDRRFLPCLSEQEAQVLEEFAAGARGVFRPLRFDAPWERALADYALMDRPGELVPVLVLAPTGSDALDFAKRSLAASLRHGGGFACGVWERDRWVVPPPANTSSTSATVAQP